MFPFQVARTLRKGAAGATKSHKGLLDRVQGFKVRTLGQLAHWAVLMAGAGLLLVLLLESTRGDAPVASFSDYLGVSLSTEWCDTRLLPCQKALSARLQSVLTGACCSAVSASLTLHPHRIAAPTPWDTSPAAAHASASY